MRRLSSVTDVQKYKTRKGHYANIYLHLIFSTHTNRQLFNHKTSEVIDKYQSHIPA